MLKTYLTTEWGLRHPIISAPMTPAAGGELARAVTDAGGIGMVGVEYRDTLEETEEQVAIVREGNSSRKFGLGFQVWALEMRPDQLELAIKLKPFFLSLSFGDISPYVAQVHAAGIMVASQIQDLESALAAEMAGADLLVAQGTEAGGHTGGIGTLPLLQLVLDRVKTPVVAAGGIATGRGLAAVLAAGAQGAWIGTPFLMTNEARIAPGAQEAIASAEASDTVLTSLFDQVQSIPWPAKFKGRTLQNDFTRQWIGHESEAASSLEAVQELRAAKAEKRFEIAHVYAGQSVGVLKEKRVAADLVREISAEAEARLSVLAG
ncbi:MAG TPA: nitronate monooxygenase [Fimbriimonas sp.]|nr:nitronate monooxygenase [Fimbriimonas sp.]